MPLNFRNHVLQQSISGQVFELVDNDILKTFELSDIHIKFLQSKLTEFKNSGGIPLDSIRKGLESISVEQIMLNDLIETNDEKV